MAVAVFAVPVRVPMLKDRRAAVVGDQVGGSRSWSWDIRRDGG
jgi:hypothetical protein